MINKEASLEKKDAKKYQYSRVVGTESQPVVVVSSIQIVPSTIRRWVGVRLGQS